MVLDLAIVPNCHVAFLPLETGLDLRRLDQVVEVVQQVLALCLRYARRVAGAACVDEDQIASRFGAVFTTGTSIGGNLALAWATGPSRRSSTTRGSSVHGRRRNRSDQASSARKCRSVRIVNVHGSGCQVAAPDPQREQRPCPCSHGMSGPAAMQDQRARGLALEAFAFQPPIG